MRKSIKQIRRERFKALVDEHGGQAKLGEKIGRSPSQVWQLTAGSEVATGRDIGDKLARTIEDALQLEPFSLDAPMPSAGIGDENEEVPIWNARAAAGISASNEDAEMIGSLLFRGRSLRKKGIQRPNAIFVSGTSMTPRLRDGDAIIYDIADQDLRSGKVYVIGLDGDTLVKRIFVEPGGQLRISSDNKSDPEFQDRIVPMDPSRIVIGGRVRWIGSWED
jgi:phage repressor protein C with HTH and peptisase S24 domain